MDANGFIKEELSTYMNESMKLLTIEDIPRQTSSEAKRRLKVCAKANRIRPATTQPKSNN